jgi:hypothetical protein
MGTPFWANIQNFPFIPTRLVLLVVPPLHAFTAGVILASVLAALFTFLFARLLGLRPLASAAAGWTFACAGTHLSHVITGQLPMVEVYPALPLLLWLTELNFQITEGSRPRGRPALALAALAAAATCVALAGHPQLGVYAFILAGLYVLFRGRGQWRAAARAIAALALGVAGAAFSLVPTLLLLGRSTRTLALARDSRDIALPYERLAAWVLPWGDGAPVELDDRYGPFNHPPDYPYFFETVNYVGLLPLAAAVLLAGWCVLRRRRPPAVAVFFAVAGTVALGTALPAFHGAGRGLTLLRNPCRQTYVTAFALALALGAVLDLIARAGAARRRAWLFALPAILLAAHAADLTLHVRHFIRSTYVPTVGDAALESTLRRLAGNDRRIGMDHTINDPINRHIDDVGFFDSIILARPYRKLMEAAGAPPDFNTQAVRGVDLPPAWLARFAVAAVVTTSERTDLPLVERFGAINVYAVPDPLPRATFVSDLTGRDSPPPSPAAAVDYARPSSDEIVVRVRDKPAGRYVRVLESFDPGWRATVNGRPAEVLPADDTFLAVAVPAGDSEVRFTYHTPGAIAGGAVSLAALVGLVTLLTFTGRTRAAVERENASEEASPPQ